VRNCITNGLPAARVHFGTHTVRNCIIARQWAPMMHKCTAQRGIRRAISLPVPLTQRS
jgi:hypothetical protein